LEYTFRRYAIDSVYLVFVCHVPISKFLLDRLVKYENSIIYFVKLADPLYIIRIW
jgi:hypothetical protein